MTEESQSITIQKNLNTRQSLQNTGREWYYHPVDGLIYQEYGDRDATSLDYLPSNHLDIRVTNASSTEENEEHRKINKMNWIEQWLGSDSDHPLSVQFVNQCTLVL